MSLAKAFEIQKNVLFALFVRELKTRAGDSPLGYIWVLVEPIGQALFMIAIWTFLRGKTVINGVEAPTFFMVMLLPFFFFRKTVSRSMGAIEANRALFNYKNVTPLDVMLNRTFMELIIHILVFCLFYLFIFLFLKERFIYDLLGFILAWVAMGIYALGAGLIALTLAYFFSIAQTIIRLFLRVLFITSGVVIPIEVVPTAFRPFALYNPLVHVIQLFKASFFKEISAELIDYKYMVFWGAGLLFIGLACFKAYRYHFLTEWKK